MPPIVIGGTGVTEVTQNLTPFAWLFVLLRMSDCIFSKRLTSLVTITNTSKRANFNQGRFFLTMNWPIGDLRTPGCTTINEDALLSLAHDFAIPRYRRAVRG